MRQLVGVIQIEWLAWRTSHSFCSSGKAPWRPEASQVLRLGSQACQASVIQQLAMLKAEGCGRIFKEKLSGREGVRRPQLDKAIEALGIRRWRKPAS